ncbi:ADP-ribosylation factor-like protein [Candidatus Lokiarchaeum ossiferum]|uniref:ADP-ribosylation factor-like protein n=1 Tax=Candidatus Lokiarchaeum ossiferum TaxID=2951803 RepID=UPI00352C5924
MKRLKIVVLGLDRAGKTVLVNYLISKKVETQFRPTLTFSIKRLKLSDRTIVFWDAPGQKNLRGTWMDSLKKADCLIYLVDVGDLDRLNESVHEFHQIAQNVDSLHIPLIFCYHKVDLPYIEENLEECKKAFDLEGLYNGKIFQLNTSVHNFDSISALEEILLTFDQ